MKRTKRMELAKETVEICERGNYRSVNGCEIDLRTSILGCLESTQFYQPDKLKQRTRNVMSQPVPWDPKAITILRPQTDRTQSIDIILRRLTGERTRNRKARAVPLKI